jgi:hypothetical protein
MQLCMEEAKPHYLNKLEKERQQMKHHHEQVKTDNESKDAEIKDCAGASIKKVSKRSLKRKLISHSSNMSLVTSATRKEWLRLRDGRLVCKFKVRIPTTGRQTLIDPSKYASNHTRFKVDSFPFIPISQLHFTNHDMEDLSRDALRPTSDSQRKRAGIFTDLEIKAAKQASLEIRKKEDATRKELSLLGLNRKKMFLLEVEREKMDKEFQGFKKIADEVINIKSGVNLSTVDFLSDSDDCQKEGKKTGQFENVASKSAQLFMSGAFDSDSD